MSGQKRPADPSSSSSSGAPPEKRRERDGEDGGAGVSAAASGSTAVETVIKLGGVSNSVSHSLLPTANVATYASGVLLLFVFVLML